MQKTIYTYKWLMVLLMLWGFSTADATPYCSSYAPKSAYQSSYTQATINNTCPTYTFHTTSVYTSVVEDPNFSPVAVDPYSNNSPRGHIRKGGWGDPDDNEIGVIADPAPIGSTFILLLMALLYLCGRVVYKRLRNG